MSSPSLQSYLDSLVTRFEQPDFIGADPISIPHGFDDPRDQEVIGLYAALLAWGRRETVLKKLAELCERMDYRPYEFVRDFDVSRDGGKLEGFKHRTFQPIDAFWLTHNLGILLRRRGTVENIFAEGFVGSAPNSCNSDGGRATGKRNDDVRRAIQGFSEAVMGADPRTPQRLRKHLARPDAGSACKRLNMYLRWMVRPGPVDLGLWETIRPGQLVLPLDVHAGRQARALGLLERRSNDWKAALALTRACREFAKNDPCRYDFAFFGTGANNVALDERFLV